MCAGDTQKVPEAFEERTRLLLGARGVGAEACPKGTPGKVELQASESGPFRSTASLLAKTVAERRRLKLSLHFELIAYACPLPLSPKWLKSSLRTLQNTNGSELRFRARLSEGCNARLEVTRA